MPVTIKKGNILFRYSEQCAELVLHVQLTEQRYKHGKDLDCFVFEFNRKKLDIIHLVPRHSADMKIFIMKIFILIFSEFNQNTGGIRSNTNASNIVELRKGNRCFDAHIYLGYLWSPVASRLWE